MPAAPPGRPDPADAEPGVSIPFTGFLLGAVSPGREEGVHRSKSELCSKNAPPLKGKAMRRNHSGSRVMEKAQDLYSNSRELAKHGASGANRFVHESPVLSAVMGVGTGFLIGLWMRRHD